MRYYPDHAGLATALLYLGAAQTFRKNQNQRASFTSNFRSAAMTEGSEILAMRNASTLSSLGGFHGMRFFEPFEVAQDELLLVAELHIAEAGRLLCSPVI
jgi:hypothetical protein